MPCAYRDDMPGCGTGVYRRAVHWGWVEAMTTETLQRTTSIAPGLAVTALAVAVSCGVSRVGVSALLVAIVLGANFLADGLRERFDPTRRERG